MFIYLGTFSKLITWYLYTYISGYRIPLVHYFRMIVRSYVLRSSMIISISQFNIKFKLFSRFILATYKWFLFTHGIWLSMILEHTIYVYIDILFFAITFKMKHGSMIHFIYIFIFIITICTYKVSMYIFISSNIFDILVRKF